MGEERTKVFRLFDKEKLTSTRSLRYQLFVIHTEVVEGSGLLFNNVGLQKFAVTMKTSGYDAKSKFSFFPNGRLLSGFMLNKISYVAVMG